MSRSGVSWIDSAVCLGASFLLGGLLGGVIESRSRDVSHSKFKPIYGFGAVLASALSPTETLCVVPCLELVGGLVFNSDLSLWRYTGHHICHQIGFPYTPVFGSLAALYSAVTPLKLH